MCSFIRFFRSERFIIEPPHDICWLQAGKSVCGEFMVFVIDCWFIQITEEPAKSALVCSNHRTVALASGLGSCTKGMKKFGLVAVSVREKIKNNGIATHILNSIIILAVAIIYFYCFPCHGAAFVLLDCVQCCCFGAAAVCLLCVVVKNDSLSLLFGYLFYLL